MEKIELHGATLPDGWTAIRPRGFGDLLLIERITPGSKQSGGATTIDLQRRVFGAGECFPSRNPINNPDFYTGRGWKKRLIQDACAWLEKTMN